MKIKFKLLIFLILFVNYSFSQVVTTQPEFPVPDESLTITFDASLCDCGLSSYTGDIYAHTGVIIEGNENWQHVVGSWGNNSSQPMLTDIGNHKYTLEISPTINEYYNIETNETVTQIALVFRSEDGSSQSSDIFIDVYSNPEEIIFSSPNTNYVYSIGDIIEIEVASLFAISLTLYINDVEVTTVDENNLTYQYTIENSGNIEITVIATDETTTVEKTTNIFVKNENTIAELPSTDLQDGINYIDANTVTLVLYAPNKEYVFLKGSFNDWEFSSDYQMKITPDGKKYWLTLENLNAGEEYIYQYVIDGNLYIADPYTDKILDPWNDLYIPESTYPNLISYPEGKTNGIVSVFQTNQPEYQWQLTNYQRPANEELVIYELLVRDFIEVRNFSALTDTLHYLKNLGVNAIELMPFNEFEGNSSWGYNPSFYFAPDKYYGTKEDLKFFIDVCHQNEVAVIMDMVLNHAYGQCPLVQMYFDPNAGDWGEPAADNPWFNQTSPNPVYSWGSDFNHESEDTKKFVKRVVNYWLEEYKIDGFRFDFTKGFTNTPGDGWNYDASRIAILKDYADEIWTTSPGAYVILEHLTDNSEEKVLANYGIMLWGNINHAYCQASMGYSSDSDFSWISYKNRSWTNPNLVGYMESHDEERQMYKNITWGNSSGSYDVTELATALKRAELTAAFFFTIPGPKMIWQFEELGYDISIDDPCRVCEKPILWEYFENENRYRLYEFFKAMINLKTNYEVFNTDDFSIYTTNYVKHIVLQSEEMDVVVIGNFDVKQQSEEAKFTNSETWYEYFTGEEILNTDTTFNLQPGEYKLFTSVKLDLPNLLAFPEAKNVYISGDTIVGSTLTGNYTFFDANGDLEKNSIYKWYRANDENGEEKIEISGENSVNYVLTEDDIDKYISFEVTPIADTYKFSTGMPTESSLFGKISEISDEINIFPNPSTSKIKFSGIKDYEEIVIKDITGKIILVKQLTGEPITEIDLTGFGDGIYIVKFTNSDNFATRKFVKLK